MIALEGVRFAYGGRPPVLLGCGLSAGAGEAVALAGPNGAGKSTLLKLAAGLLKPQQGEVLLDGRPVLGWRRAERSKRLAYVPQSPVAPQDWPVHALVEMGDHPHRRSPPAPRPLSERLRAARTALDLEEIWEREARTLSGGEGQRVVLGRAVVQDAQNLVLDEPASHLDLAHQLALFGMIARWAQEGRTVLLSTHDINLSVLCGQRLVLMERGGSLSPFPDDPEAQSRSLEAAFGVPFVPVEVRGRTCWFPGPR